MQRVMMVRKPLFWLVLIMALAAAPRVVNLERIPAGSDGDVAWYGINALDWVDRGVWPYYIRELYGAEPLSVYSIGALIPLVGINETAPRLASALWNVMGVGMLYAAAYWLLFGEAERVRARAGLLAALAGAISLHAIYVSRLGLPAPFIPAVVGMLVAATAWARAKGRWWRWVVAGIALALTQYIYIAARVIPLAVVLWFVHDVLSDRAGFKRRWRGWVLMAVVALVLVTPNLITYTTLPRAFFGRAEAATPFSGALIWTFDTGRYGGPVGLMLQKVLNNFRAVGISWLYGPYTTELAQPILTPVFFAGFLLTMVVLVRRPRQIGTAWLWLALPVLLLPDVLTSATTAPHAMRQVDVLTPVFVLAGIGLAYGWEWINAHRIHATPTPTLPRTQGRVCIGTLVLGAAVVVTVGATGWDWYRYFVVQPPQLYADRETSWRRDQASLDMSRRIVAHPENAYLIPYTEWERSTISWITAGAFRQRGSAINAAGMLTVASPPARVTVMEAADPKRVRWDGSTAQVDDRLWVLLDQGRTLLLPPLTADQVGALQTAQAAAAGEVLMDLSGQPVATFYDLATPTGLFDARAVVDYPTDATFGGEVHLNGYSVANRDLTPGQPFFVSLYWTTLRPPTEDYEIFVQLWNDHGQAVTQWQNVPFGAMYRMRIWQGTEMLATHHWLQLPADAPVGRYRLVVGVYRTLKGERVPVEGGSADVANKVAVAGILRVPLVEAPAELPAPLQVITFGDELSLGGMEIKTPSPLTPHPQGEWREFTVRAGQTINLKVLWDVLKVPPVDYTVFLHLTPVGGDQPSAQVDRLIRPDYPTGVWRAGDLINDSIDFALPSDLPTGEYDLWMGMYYWQTGERLAIYTRGDGDVTADQRLRLARVKVE